MNTAISDSPDAIFWPKSTYELADLMNGVASFGQTRFGDLYDQVRAVQRDEGSFRGSAMQAWDLMVRNTAAKFDPMPATLRPWPSSFATWPTSSSCSSTGSRRA